MFQVSKSMKQLPGRPPSSTDIGRPSPGTILPSANFQRFFVSHVAAAVVARVYAHFNELRRRARAFVLHEAR